MASIPVNKEFQCLTCEKIFATKSKLMRHTYIHQSTSKFKCKECSKILTTSENLARHERSHHSKKKFVCKHCSHAFKTKFLLEEHHRNVHLTTKLFQCATCKAEFSWEENLKKHEHMHKEENYKCSICSKVFCDSVSLRVHRRVHQPSVQAPTTNSKPFQCNKCSLSFQFDFSYEAHLQSHEVELDCNIEKNDQPINYNPTPIIIVSPMSNTADCSDNENNKTPNKLRISTRRNKYNCKRKPYYGRFGTLNMTDHKPYGCMQCKKTFRWEVSLQVHLKEHNLNAKIDSMKSLNGFTSLETDNYKSQLVERKAGSDHEDEEIEDFQQISESIPLHKSPNGKIRQRNTGKKASSKVTRKKSRLSNQKSKTRTNVKRDSTPCKGIHKSLEKKDDLVLKNSSTTSENEHRIDSTDKIYTLKKLENGNLGLNGISRENRLYITLQRENNGGSEDVVKNEHNFLNNNENVVITSITPINNSIKPSLNPSLDKTVVTTLGENCSTSNYFRHMLECNSTFHEGEDKKKESNDDKNNIETECELSSVDQVFRRANDGSMTPPRVTRIQAKKLENKHKNNENVKRIWDMEHESENIVVGEMQTDILDYQNFCANDTSLLIKKLHDNLQDSSNEIRGINTESNTLSETNDTIIQSNMILNNEPILIPNSYQVTSAVNSVSNDTLDTTTIIKNNMVLNNEQMMTQNSEHASDEPDIVSNVSSNLDTVIQSNRIVNNDEKLFQSSEEFSDGPKSVSNADTLMQSNMNLNNEQMLFQNSHLLLDNQYTGTSSSNILQIRNSPNRSYEKQSHINISALELCDTKNTSKFIELLSKGDDVISNSITITSPQPNVLCDRIVMTSTSGFSDLSVPVQSGMSSKNMVDTSIHTVNDSPIYSEDYSKINKSEIPSISQNISNTGVRAESENQVAVDSIFPNTVTNNEINSIFQIEQDGVKILSGNIINDTICGNYKHSITVKDTIQYDLSVPNSLSTYQPPDQTVSLENERKDQQVDLNLKYKIEEQHTLSETQPQISTQIQPAISTQIQPQMSTNAASPVFNASNHVINPSLQGMVGVVERIPFQTDANNLVNAAKTQSREPDKELVVEKNCNISDIESQLIHPQTDMSHNLIKEENTEKHAYKVITKNNNQIIVNQTSLHSQNIVNNILPTVVVPLNSSTEYSGQLNSQSSRAVTNKESKKDIICSQPEITHQATLPQQQVFDNLGNSLRVENIPIVHNNVSVIPGSGSIQYVPNNLSGLQTKVMPVMPSLQQTLPQLGNITVQPGVPYVDNFIQIFDNVNNLPLQTSYIQGQQISCINEFGQVVAVTPLFQIPINQDQSSFVNAIVSNSKDNNLLSGEHIFQPLMAPTLVGSNTVSSWNMLTNVSPAISASPTDQASNLSVLQSAYIAPPPNTILQNSQNLTFDNQTGITSVIMTATTGNTVGLP